MSYFNEDQIAHMDYIASIPPQLRCWCGWYDAFGQPYKLGKCPNGCPKDKTCADKLAEREILAAPEQGGKP